ncbi:hypothetical protein ACQK5W_02355 [Pantoea sp. FN060301]|uniref:hypothetical protein n=1 Tax=Pantoea sp. FN060301 TaxID=3420380 RepID=UPI003D17FA9F
MKEISLNEMDDVSGAYSWDFSSITSLLGSTVANAGELVASATIGACVGTMAGAVIGGKHGGDGGGILGFGIIGQGVGMIGAGIIGGVASGIAAAVVGWDTTEKYAFQAVDGLINGTIS